MRNRIKMAWDTLKGALRHLFAQMARRRLLKMLKRGDPQLAGLMMAEDPDLLEFVETEKPKLHKAEITVWGNKQTLEWYDDPLWDAMVTKCDKIEGEFLGKDGYREKIEINLNDLGK